MYIVLLGGRSKRNHPWVRELADELRPLAENIIIHDYDHWQTGVETVDIQKEAVQLACKLQGVDQYIIVAKSIGTVITMLGVQSSELSPQACMFLGTPLGIIKEELPEIDDVLPLLPRTAFMQNEHDPLGGAEMLREYILQHEPSDWELVALPGDTHDYMDFEQIQKTIQKLVSIKTAS